MTDEWSPTYALQTYDLTTEPDGTIVGTAWTNDDEDRGYPNECSRWEVRYDSREDALKRTGGSHVGVSGIVVVVTLDGKELLS